jgi:hypothetical protein
MSMLSTNNKKKLKKKIMGINNKMSILPWVGAGKN